MMKSVVGFTGMAVLILLAGAASVQAQTPPVAAPGRPVPSGRLPEPAQASRVSRWYLGGLSGIQVVDRAAALAGGEFGVRLKRNLQVVVEGARFGDVVTGSRVEELGSYTTYIQQTQGRVATSEIDAPAWVGTAGLRYIYENTSGVRPYLLANAGLARVEYRPTFTLNGQVISTNVSQYGVTLGRDLLGPGNHFAYGGGAGLVFGETWYFDVGVRFTRIQTPDHDTNVRRLSLGIGRRF